jgi:hypothetical protein
VAEQVERLRVAQLQRRSKRKWGAKNDARPGTLAVPDARDVVLGRER